MVMQKVKKVTMKIKPIFLWVSEWCGNVFNHASQNVKKCKWYCAQNYR